MPSTDGKPDTLPYWGWWPPWNPAALPGYSPAPPSLTQPILPGWTFGNVISITETNSRAPETERAIVEKISYGRQIGELMDAVVVLIGERPESAPDQPALNDLIQLHDKIEHIKEETLALRIERLKRDLTRLKKESPESLRHVAQLVRELEEEAK